MERKVEKIKLVEGDMFYLKMTQFETEDVDIFEKISSMNEHQVALVPEEEWKIYEKVKLYLKVMNEYRQKDDIWWEDKSEGFIYLAYKQLKEDRVFLIDKKYLTNLVNSLLKTNYIVSEVLEHRKVLSEQLYSKISTLSKITPQSNLSD